LERDRASGGARSNLLTGAEILCCRPDSVRKLTRRALELGRFFTRCLLLACEVG
jgi:hypothetical protein